MDGQVCFYKRSFADPVKPRRFTTGSMEPLRGLHNICEIHYEHFNDAWIQNSEGEYDQPATVMRRDSSDGSPHTIRNALVSYFQSKLMNMCICIIC